MIQDQQQDRVRLRQLLLFFLPLGLSSTLVVISHVIINSTLARSPNPEFVIASYAIPLSFISLTERPLILLRQTCSALVRDRISFRAMARVSSYVLTSTFIICLIIAFTPLGDMVFRYLFGVEESMLEPILRVYRVLMFVCIFSGIRCLFHGVIISNMRTKWLTIGMVIRLVAMYILSLFFIRRGVDSGMVGAVIFLVGMIIESTVATIEGRRLVKKSIPEKKEDHSITTTQPIFKFYKPLLMSSFIAAIIGPATNAMLGKTVNIQLAISSFSVASSLNLLMLSFFTYLHQIILNFYRKDAKLTKRFVFTMAFFPGILMGLLAFSPIGAFVLENIMGIQGELLSASLATLRVFALHSLIYPWVDICNGYIMLVGQTKAMLRSQSMNAVITVIVLVTAVSLTPGWNGMVGALSQSLGLLAEFIVLLLVIRSLRMNRPIIKSTNQPSA